MNTDKNDYVVVIGGINIDIEARSFAPIISADSNPGIVSSSLGGVGFNIARNLSLTDTKVIMLTALSKDENLEAIYKEAKELSIDLSHAKLSDKAHSNSYVYICDPKGEMALAVCDGELFHAIDKAYIDENIDLINKAEAVVIDANLDKETIDYVALKSRAPIFADPVSTTKASRMKDILCNVYAFKPNIKEASTLTGIEYKDEQSVISMARALNVMGVKHSFISLGTDGICVMDGDEEPFTLPIFNCKSINTTGAGDGLMAGIVKAYTLGLKGKSAGLFAESLAGFATESKETVNKDINLQNVLKRAGISL